MNQVIDTTEDRLREVNSLFTTLADANVVSDLNIQDSISDVKELPVTSSVILNSEASCSAAIEKLPSIITSSKLCTETANETTLAGEVHLAHLALVHLQVIQFTVHYCS